MERYFTSLFWTIREFTKIPAPGTNIGATLDRNLIHLNKPIEIEVHRIRRKQTSEFQYRLSNVLKNKRLNAIYGYKYQNRALKTKFLETLNFHPASTSLVEQIKLIDEINENELENSDTQQSF